MSIIHTVLRKLGGKEDSFKYANNAIWLFSEKGLRAIEAFLVGLWIARYLGPEDFGLLNYAYSFVFLFTAIGTLGLDQIVVKDLVNKGASRDLILGTTLGLRAIGFVVMGLLIFLILKLLNGTEQVNKLIWIITFSVLFQSFNGIDFYFQSKVESKYITWVNMIMVVISACVKIALIVYQADLIYFAWVYCLETIISAIGYIYFYKREGLSLHKWKFSWTTAKGLLSRSWFLIVGTIATAIYMKIDQVMIKDIIDDRAAGLYSAAVKACSIWLFVTVVITQSIFPSLVKLKKKNQELFLNQLQHLYNILVKIAIVACIVYTVFADWIIKFLFDLEYAESSGIMTIYIWSIIFVFLSNGSWGFYLNENLEKFSSIRLIIGAIINVILNLLLIDKIGLLGAAYATLVSYSISGYFVNALFKRTRPNFVLQTRSLFNFLNLKTWIRPMG